MVGEVEGGGEGEGREEGGRRGRRGRGHTVWVEDGGFEDHFWGQVGVFGGEDEVGAEEASFCVFVSSIQSIPVLSWGKTYRRRIYSRLRS